MPLLRVNIIVVIIAAIDGVIASTPYKIKWKQPELNITKFLVSKTHTNGNPNEKLKNTAISFFVPSTFIFASF